MPVSYINHKGREILYIDLTESKSEQRSLELLEETKDAYLKANEKLLVLVNTQGAFVSTEVSSRMKEYSKLYFKDRAEKRVFVGVSGLKKIIMRAYMSIAGENIKLMDDLEEAKDYLVS